MYALSLSDNNAMVMVPQVRTFIARKEMACDQNKTSLKPNFDNIVLLFISISADTNTLVVMGNKPSENIGLIMELIRHS
jgi:hypothetical protein